MNKTTRREFLKIGTASVLGSAGAVLLHSSTAVRASLATETPLAQVIYVEPGVMSQIDTSTGKLINSSAWALATPLESTLNRIPAMVSFSKEALLTWMENYDVSCECVPNNLS